MELPERSLVGARIVNVGCRRGKGTYKLSEQVGEGGFVVGVDWNEVLWKRPGRACPGALERSRLSRCNMAFRCGFPRDLVAAGIEGWARRISSAPEQLAFLFASPARALRAKVLSRSRAGRRAAGRGARRPSRTARGPHG